MVKERAQMRELSAPTGRLWVGVLAGGGGHAQAGNPKLGERSASASQVRMQCECNLGNCAYECHVEADTIRASVL
eukprot:6196047-Pleurochrysis_carterae.AAC.1